MRERQATDVELDSILTDVLSFKKGASGYVEESRQTMTLREAVALGYSGLVHDASPVTLSSLLNLPGAE